MLFSQLCTEAGLDGSRTGEAEVGRVVADSRKAQAGDCFVALRGAEADGHAYIRSATAAGCTAVVCEDPSAVPDGVACLAVPGTRAAAGPLAQASLGWPARKLVNVGVTGTNGKTTFTYLLRDILRRAGHNVAMLGTITYDTIAGAAGAGTTTPGAVELAEMTAAVVAAGGTHLVMEISSHALDQDRVAGIDFAVGAFTNLTGDHLDYHGTMARYLACKRRLFESLALGAAAVLNRDDPYSEQLAAATRAKLLWYGLSSAAHVQGLIQRIDAGGSRFSIRCAGAEADVRTRLIGRHNVSNSLAAAATAVALGVDLAVAADALAAAGHVPGRLQPVAAETDFDVLVDYAHTDDALANVLSALRPVTAGRLILVFGCGGDRDRTKRPRMAHVAELWADAVVVTSDNPRGEEPGAIIDEIVAGFSAEGRAKVRVEPDRRAAIAAALKSAGAGDVVLIAGKGHETYQDIGGVRVHFDDAETAGELLRTGRM